MNSPKDEWENNRVSKALFNFEKRISITRFFQMRFEFELITYSDYILEN